MGVRRLLPRRRVGIPIQTIACGELRRGAQQAGGAVLQLNNRYISIMVLYAIALHFVWACLLMIDHAATQATAVNALSRYINSPELLALVVATAGGAALVGLSMKSAFLVMLLLPQQILLMMSAAGAVEAIWLSQFADGVVRSRAFIAADQVYSVLAAIGHTTAITMHAWRADTWRPE
jgi:hypothetical protein